jgi:large subunit ribosomal protein L29
MKLVQLRQQLRDSTVAELEHMLQEERKNLFMSRRDYASKQLENPMKISQSRKNIARILTVLRSRELESVKGKK